MYRLMVPLSPIAIDTNAPMMVCAVRSAEQIKLKSCRALRARHDFLGGLLAEFSVHALY